MYVSALRKFDGVSRYFYIPVLEERKVFLSLDISLSILSSSRHNLEAELPPIQAIFFLIMLLRASSAPSFFFQFPMSIRYLFISGRFFVMINTIHRYRQDYIEILSQNSDF